MGDEKPIGLGDTILIALPSDRAVSMKVTACEMWLGSMSEVHCRLELLEVNACEESTSEAKKWHK